MRAELGAHAGGENLQDEHGEEDVERDAELDDERHAGGRQEGDQGDAVVERAGTRRSG